MRTTLNLDDHLAAEAKALALKTNRTLTSLIEEALREVILRSKVEPTREAFVMPVFAGKGPRAGTLPGIDLDRTSELLEL